MRRAVLLVGAMLAALVAVSGVAWALTTIRCPHDPYNWNTERACYPRTARQGLVLFRHTLLLPPPATMSGPARNPTLSLGLALRKDRY
jgi:hypothetical protein